MSVSMDEKSDMGLTVTGKGMSKRELGQFLTPAPIADFMASMFAASHREWSILDAGAGAGALSKALVSRICATAAPGTEIKVTAYELDRTIIPRLRRELESLHRQCSQGEIRFSATILNADFIECASSIVSKDLFSSNCNRFNAAILNPPYRKINSDSESAEAAGMLESRPPIYTLGSLL